MTILPKKKENRKGEEHESETRNRSRNRTSREGRCPRPGPGGGSSQQSVGAEADVNHTQNQQIYNNIASCPSSEETVSLSKRTRHNNRKIPYHNSHSPPTSSSSLLPSKSAHCSKRNIAQEDEDEEDDKADGYNSSDEYDPREPKGSTIDVVQMEKNFERDLCEEKGFSIKEMATDGACMFRAVADQIYGDQEMHGVVRRHCMDYMVKNRDFFSQYVTEDFNSYIGRKRNEHSHGNHVEMQALTEMYNRPIEVYQYSAEPINTFHGRSCNTDDTPPIRLSYHGNVHYNSIIDPYNPTVGVGLGLAGYKPGKEDEESLNSCIKESEKSQLEQAMLEDKLKATDWEAAEEDIAEMVARESYLQWVKENQKTTGPGASSTAASTSGKPHSSSSSAGKGPALTHHNPTKIGLNVPASSHHNLHPSVHQKQQQKISPNRKSPSRKSPPRKSPPRKGNEEVGGGSCFEGSSPNLPSCSRYPAEGTTTLAHNEDDLNNTNTNYSDWQFSAWDGDGEDDILAAVLAQSQQDYLQQLQKQQSATSTSTSSPPQQRQQSSTDDTTS